MAIKRKGKPAPEAKIQMTSMIDVVFLLIIFFMIVTEMTKMEIEELTLPKAYSGQSEKKDPKRRLIINLTKRGKIVIKRQRYDLARLRHLLNQMVKFVGTDRGSAAEAPASELFVKIRADADTEYQYVFEIMAQCAHVGIFKLSFAVEPTEGGF